jgi:agmatine deiminase
MTDALAMQHYHMPAEWARHRGTILTWPHRPQIWRGVHGAVEETFAALIRELSEVEEVHVNVPNATVAAHAQRLAMAAGAQLHQVHWHLIDSDDVWARDHGPIFVVRRSDAAASLPPLAMLDWEFNAWGGKFASQLDNLIPRQLAALWNLPRVAPGLVMEGGSLEVNGAGDLLTTEAVLLNTNRNPHLQRPQIEATLRQTLGVSRLHWLGQGLEGDDTDGHIDDIARFVDASTVVVACPADPDHPDYAAMRDNHARLQQMRGADGKLWQVVKLPVPDPISFAGEHLPASYANFYICNGKVLVPTFAQPSDAEALAILQALMPGRRVVGLDGRWLVTQYGNIHCVTQQIPAVD